MDHRRLSVITGVLLLAACSAFGQSAPPVSINFKPPAGVMVFGEFNQLGNPRITGGVGGIYPVIGSIGIYGTTILDVLPKLALDPTTQKDFYAISVSARQGFHKTILCTGKFCSLLGADIGPSFSQNTASVAAGGTTAITVSFSTSATVTMLFQVSPAFSLIAPVRMLYVPNAGWNPVAEFGGLINLGKLPAANVTPLTSTPTAKQMRAVMKRLHLPVEDLK